MKYKLGDIATFSQGKQIEIDEQFLKKDENHSIRFIRIVDYTNPEEPIRYVKNYGERYYATENEVIMIRYGSQTAGKVVMGKNGIIANNMFKMNFDNSIIKNKYAYYYLSQDRIFNYLRSSQSSSTMPAISFGMLNDFVIDIPEIRTQEKVIALLDIIDKIINYNAHTNNNLYETFRSIYKNTFLNKTTNTIKFSDFNEIGSLVMGQSPKGSSYNEEKIGLPLINGAADYKDGMLNPNKYTSEPTRVCNAKDLVFCIRATIGQLTIADQEYCLGRGVACISNINELYYEYVFNIIEESIDKLKAVATGSVILGLSKDDINNLEVYKPTLEEIKKFHKLEQPILNRIIEIKKQNKTF